MNNRTNWIWVLALLALCSGCDGCRQLDPAGQYKGDQALYQAHRAVLDSYDLMHAFVSWEYQNREALKKWPKIEVAANKIRRNAEHWLGTAAGLVDAYEKEPNDQTRTAMQKGIETLRAALAEASSYMADHKNLK